MNTLKKLLNDIYAEVREHKSSFIVYIVLRTLVVITFVFQLLNHNYESAFLCILTLVLLIMPSLVQVTFKVEFPTLLEIIILIFVFAAEILGEIQEFYMIFPFWDTILHTINGFLCAAIGLSLVDLFNRSDKLMFKLSPFFTVITAFCFSMTIGVLWEFGEFGIDRLFACDTQKDTVIHNISSVLLDPQNKNIPVHINNITEVIVQGQSLNIGGYLDIGLIDTMSDLFVNFIGALVFSVFGYFYIKKQNKKSTKSIKSPKK